MLSLGLMMVAAFGYIPAVVGALTQELVDLACIIYALRARRGGMVRSPQVELSAGEVRADRADRAVVGGPVARDDESRTQ